LNYLNPASIRKFDGDEWEGIQAINRALVEVGKNYSLPVIFASIWPIAFSSDNMVLDR